jgi:hypothetical protein
VLLIVVVVSLTVIGAIAWRIGGVPAAIAGAVLFGLLVLIRAGPVLLAAVFREHDKQNERAG